MTKKLLALIMILSALLIFATSCGDQGGATDGNDSVIGDDVKDDENENGNEDEGADAHIHEFGEWTELTPPSCTADGNKKRSCACGETEIAPIPHYGHNTEYYDGLDPTCTEPGYAAYEACTNCDFSTYSPIDPLLHNPGTPVITDHATCQIEGKKITYCTRCNDVIEVELIGKAAHEGGRYVPLDGSAHANTCKNCGVILSEEAHELETVTVKAPTYIEWGAKQNVCDICDFHSDTEPLEPLPKEKPEYTVPTGLTASWGDVIGDVTLPLGFAFVDDESTVLDSVGIRSFELIYTVPNDTESKYESVRDIWVSINVLPIKIVIDAQAPEGKVYDGEPVASPEIFGEYKEMISVKWYSGDVLLSEAPFEAGSYRIVLAVEVEFITADPLTLEVTIEKSSGALDGYTVEDIAYSGKAIVLPRPNCEGEVSMTVTDLEGNPLIPTELGDYILTVSVSESANYVAAEGKYYFSVVPDTMPPVFTIENHSSIKSGIATIPIVDNVGIAYYEIDDVYAPNYYETKNNVLDFKAGQLYAIRAVDLSGNMSEELYIYVAPDCLDSEGIYTPEIYPANGAVVTDPYVFITATDSSYIELGTDLDMLYVLDGGIATMLENGKTYYWRANSGFFNTPVYSFTVSYEESTTPVLDYPADNAVLTEGPILLSAHGEGEITIYYRAYGMDDSTRRTYYRDSPLPGDYGVRYVWYAENDKGERSEERTFTFLPENVSQCNDGLWFVGGSDVTYIDESFFVVRASSLLAVGGVRYLVVKADGSYEQVRYEATSFARNYHNSDGKGEYYDLIGELDDGDTVYYYLIGSRFQVSRSEVRKLIVDLSAPIAGEASIKESASGFDIEIPLGSDNVGATYFYRINHGEWIEYDSTVNLCLNDPFVFIEVKAEDYAGHSTVAAFTANKTEISAPTIDAGDYVSGTPIASDVILTLAPAAEGESKYFINGEEHALTESELVEFTKDGIYEVYTSVTKDGVAVNSATFTVFIDKTAPVFSGVILRDDVDEYTNAWWTAYVLGVGSPDLLCRYLSFGSGDFNGVLIDPALTEDSSRVSYSFKLAEINDCYKTLDAKGYFPMQYYMFVNSGIYTIVVRAEDEAGNYTELSFEWKIDVEAPTAESTVIDRGESGEDIIFKLDGIKDDHGFCPRIDVYVIPLDAYLSGEGIIVDTFESEEGFTGFVYDASYLPKSDLYMVVFKLYDNLGNHEFVSQFTFYRIDKTKSETTEDGLTFESTDDGYRLVSINTDKELLILPETYKGESYTVITGALLYNTTVKEIVVPKGLGLDWASFASSDGIERIYYCGSREEWVAEGHGSEENFVFPLYKDNLKAAYLSAEGDQYDLWAPAPDGTPVLLPKESK